MHTVGSKLPPARVKSNHLGHLDCSRSSCSARGRCRATTQLVRTSTLWPAQLAVLSAASTSPAIRFKSNSSTLHHLRCSVLAAAPNADWSSLADELDPRLLTRQIQQARQVEQLQQLWQQHKDQFNHIHFSVLMQRLAVLHQTPELAQQQQPHQQVQDAMLDMTAAAAAVAASTLQDFIEESQPGDATDNASSSTGSAANSSSGSSPTDSLKQQQQQGGGLVRPHFLRKSWQNQQNTRQQQQSVQQLAHTVAAAALSPSMWQQLDKRAVVMISHSLAKIGLQDAALLDRIVQATSSHHLLQRLDSQQLTNLVWSVAVCVGSVKGIAGASMPTYDIAVNRDAESMYESSALAVATTRMLAPANGSNSIAVRCSSGSNDTGVSVQSVKAATPPLIRFELPSEWLSAVAEAFINVLPRCSSCGISMAVWGFAQLRSKPSVKWMKDFFNSTSWRLTEFSPNELAVLAYALGRFQVEIPADWLSQYLSASTETLVSLSPQELSMSLWGLASCNALPHKAWLMAWFLCSRANMERASTQDLSMWLYSLALLRMTPSPLWCTSYVETSYQRLTAPTTRPQELVNVMWAISCMGWNPPLLYWKGLLDAAKTNMKRFNPQDLANCISAAAAVDVASLERSWVATFIRVSQRKLPSFRPVHLAHTAAALSIIDKKHAWACGVIHAAWQEAFVQAAVQHIAGRRFRVRTLELVVHGVRQMQFLPTSLLVQEFLQRGETLLQHMKAREQKDGQ